MSFAASLALQGFRVVGFRVKDAGLAGSILLNLRIQGPKEQGVRSQISTSENIVVGP